MLGPEDPYTATSLNNLAQLLKAQGDFAGAQALYERALAIREKSLGPEHPETASALQDQGDLVGARPLLERALAICEKILGPKHPETAPALNDLAILLQDQGDLEEAHLLYERALAIREKALGRDHPVTAISIMNFAILQQEQSHFSGARPLYERALEICAQANIVRYNWARFLLKTGQPTDALALKPPSPRRQGFSDLISPTPQAWPASLASTRLAAQRTRRRCGSDMGSGGQ
jgi:tetratricopeptide (TPR) repeat protein